MRANIDRLLDVKQKRRLAAEGRAEQKLLQCEANAENLIGELNSGKCYIYPIGGRYREGSRAELLSFLLRNNYV